MEHKYGTNVAHSNPQEEKLRYEGEKIAYCKVSSYWGSTTRRKEYKREINNRKWW